MVHILTHNDLDGYSAGYVALQHFGAQNCNIEHYNYDREPNIEDFKEGDIVVITDYSLSNDQYRQILSKIGDEGSLIWCDHHITAINRYNEDKDLCCEGLRSVKYCGAVLTYLYFNTNVDTEDIETLSYDKLMEKVPLWLRLVDAWDTWKLDVPYRRNAELLNLGIQNDLCMENIKKIAKRAYDGELLRWINTGKMYERYRDDWSKQLREMYLFDKMLDGSLFNTDRKLTAAILNVGNANSTFFGNLINKYDVCVTICFNGELWKVSLYSSKDDVDCSYFAKQHNGGGHKGAAGCVFEQLTPPAFILNNDEDIIVKEKKENGKV